MAALVELKCLDCERSLVTPCPFCDGSGVVSHTDIYIDSLPEAAIEYGERLVCCKILTEEKE